MVSITKKSFPIVLLVFFLYGCLGYKSFNINGYKSTHRPLIQQGISKNKVYIHTKKGSYEMTSTTLEGDKLSGDLTLVKDVNKLDSLKSNEEKVKKGDFRLSALNFYIDSLETQSKNYDIASNDSSFNDEILLQKENLKGSMNLNEIEKMQTYASGSNRVGMIILIVIGALIVTLLLLWLIILLIAKAAQEGGEASSDGSGESSGASSGENGSCYIATMTYGSYDAPEVLTLRSFRDKFLKKRKWGRQFIAFYYRTAPKFVDKHKRNKRIHSIIRFVLNRFVSVLRLLNF